MSLIIYTTVGRGNTPIGKFEGRFTPKEFELLRIIPGRKKWVQEERDGKQKAILTFELSRQNINFIREHYPNAVWKDVEPLHNIENIEHKEEWIRQAKRYEELIVETPFEFKTKPFDHQRKAFYLSRDEQTFGLFMEMGTGKTKVICDTAAYLYEKGEIDVLFVVAPNGVHRQWVDEQIPTHLPDWCERHCIAYQSNHNKKWQAEWAKVWEAENGLKVITMHVEAFSYANGKDYAKMILQKGRCLWVLDESTRIKNSGVARTKNINKLAKLAKYRRILSGAPITQGIEDLYSQFMFLDEAILGFSSFYTFRNYFCDTRPIEGAPANAVKVVGYKNQEELKKLVEGHTFRVTKNDCLDLPAKIYTTKQMEMDDEQRRLYTDMKDELQVVLKDNTVIEAPLAITQLMKLQQILCGFLIDEEGQVKRLSTTRSRMVVDMLGDIQGKVLVWSRFREELLMLREAMTAAEIGFVEYHGGINQEMRKLNLNAFQTDPSIKVFLANPQAGGTGLNLACASTAIYVSNDFNADTRWQSEDRIHRIGQKFHATYIDIVCRGTIDTKILASLRAKKNVADSVLDVKELLAD